jgi:hypothetical protein
VLGLRALAQCALLWGRTRREEAVSRGNEERRVGRQVRRITRHSPAPKRWFPGIVLMYAHYAIPLSLGFLTRARWARDECEFRRHMC